LVLFPLAQLGDGLDGAFRIVAYCSNLGRPANRTSFTSASGRLTQYRSRSLVRLINLPEQVIHLTAELHHLVLQLAVALHQLPGKIASANDE
jgi:hypothetical protein